MNHRMDDDGYCRACDRLVQWMYVARLILGLLIISFGLFALLREM